MERDTLQGLHPDCTDESSLTRLGRRRRWPRSTPSPLVGEYVFGEEIAAGGCGVVYRATHRVLGQCVAIKVLHAELTDNAGMRERLVREAQITSTLRHPNIVDVFGLGRLPDGRPFYVMELLDGDNLETILQRHGALPLERVVTTLAQIGAALDVTHRAGILHRDVKASNVFAARTVVGDVVKLLDFGIATQLVHDARPTASGLTPASERLGTPTAMSPEQILGHRVDERSDVYALGALAYHLLVGKPPFEGRDRFETERLHVDAEPPAASARVPVPVAVDEIIARALAKDPALRPASAGQFVLELAAAARTRSATDTICVRARLDALPPHGLDQLARMMDLAERLLVEHGLAIESDESTWIVARLRANDSPRKLGLVGVLLGIVLHQPIAQGLVEVVQDGGAR